MPLLRTLALALAATALAAAEELPTPVEARLDTIALPRVIHAGSYAYAPSPVTGSALFAAEYLTPDTLDGPARRHDPFAADPDLPPEQRVSPGDYEATGFDRGHAVPFQNHKRSQATADATFRMTNMYPQPPRINRVVWPRIERAAREPISDTRTAYVVTVAIYDFRQKPVAALPRCGVLIPTRLAKAMLIMAAGEPESMRAWIVPNDPATDGQATDYAATVDQVEAATQLDLFSWLDDELETRLESQK